MGDARMTQVEYREDSMNRPASKHREQSGGAQAAFSTQLDTFPQAAPRNAPYTDSYATYSVQQAPMQRLDMGSVAAALPDGLPSSAYTYAQQSPSYAHGVPAQHMPNQMAFRPQMPQYVSQQAYLANMPIHGVMPRAQPHFQAMPGQYYGGYTTAPHMAMQHLVQGNTRYSMPFGGSHGKHDLVAPQLHAQAPSGLVGHENALDSPLTYPRGPPRKPKQSGYALWVGNLPPGTTVVALKDHFSREATQDIESLFLISKSNCAFVNYRSEEACAAAMTRFHDSRFQGVRLVCRLRRGMPSTPVSENLHSAPVPAKKQGASKEDSDKSSDFVVIASSTGESPKKEKPREQVDGLPTPEVERVPDRYFIVKSLTLQDLEASVRNGIWATQSHNEGSLNKAFETADNVYLVFSANKSGEYFGYARMTSAVAPESVTENPKTQSERKDVDRGPKSISTPATEWAPKGRIVDDSARGTIFWEAENPNTDVESSDGIASKQEEPVIRKQGQDWGKPFNIDWLSTNRLPFYRTRGLRNPWNENREVKIARDGTEIEPGIGSRLVQMFHRPAAPSQGQVSTSVSMASVMPRLVSPTMQQYPHH